MPDNTITLVSKEPFSKYDVIGGNGSDNVTYIMDGPIVELMRENQFQTLLPSFIYTATLMSFGLPGNLMVILVYLLKMSKTTSRHFIISLAICDFINCSFGMPVELVLLSNFLNFDYPILCKISRFCTFFMNNGSSCILVAIAIDRFRRVCLPLRPNMTVAHSKIICIGCAIFSMISALPALYIYGTHTKSIKDPSKNNTIILVKTCYIDDSIGRTIPLGFNLYLFIGTLTMFLSMTIMYAFIARIVCRKGKFTEKSIRRHTFKYENTVTVDPRTTTPHTPRLSVRILRRFSEYNTKLLGTGRKSPRSESPLPDITEPLSVKDRAHSDTSVRRHGGKDIRAGRTTLILFIVTLIFVLSFVPYLAIVTIRYISPIDLRPLPESVYNLTLRSYLLNSAANPLVYCFLNRQFRGKVKQFFKSIFFKRR